MQPLSLIQASKIVDASLERAREFKCQPLTVAVLDAGGHLVALKREDGSGILRPQIAQAKAWGALGMGHGGRALAERAAAAPAFFAALTDISGGRIAPVPGGVLVRDGSGNILGAVGISGDHPDKDEACAVFAIQSVELMADGG
ncbi:GlcG/HbpS family heme-binding protein [Paraburkholderia sediminicola]|uniref:GlcG/HbpS family heme-binding protein n=1 Tax=Paraburkholderia sediminicola TaxID=458836 RepID=UPI0038BDA0CF